jgi:hypothetical protein
VTVEVYVKLTRLIFRLPAAAEHVPAWFQLRGIHSVEGPLPAAPNVPGSPPETKSRIRFYGSYEDLAETPEEVLAAIKTAQLDLAEKDEERRQAKRKP